MSSVPKTGRLLVATKELVDPNFAGTVVLVCRYAPHEGAFGLVLNRPTGIQIGKVAGDEAHGRREPLWIGGPVDGRTLRVLHRMEGLADPGDEVAAGVFLSSRPAVVRRMLGAHFPDEEGSVFRYFVGYAGWSEGQLEAEIAEGAWSVVPFAGSGLFSGRAESFWVEMRVRAGLVRALDFASIPESRWN